MPDKIRLAACLERSHGGRCHSESQLSGICHITVSEMKHHRYSARAWLPFAILVSATALLLLFSSPAAQAGGTAYVSNMGKATHSTTSEVSKPRPRWDVHLPDAGNRAGNLAGVLRPSIAAPSGSAV